MRILRPLLVSIVLTFMATGANAMNVAATFTGDDVAFMGLCSDMSCTAGSQFPATPNSGNWKIADTINMALGVGTHWFAWRVDNVGSPGSGNPAGFLGELVWDAMTNASSSAWDVATTLGSWSSATEWGSNDGSSNIWTDNNGGPIAGISGAANWLWTANNFGSTTEATAYFRTSITILPEPGTLGLLAFGLAGAAWLRRRRIS